MIYHPLKNNDEIFLGNTQSNSGIPEYLKPLKPIRTGKPAYDICGKKLDSSYMALFINKSESSTHEKIMNDRMKKIMETY